MKRTVIAALLVAASPALAEKCPMDRTTFVEKDTKAQFVADKVAVAYRYLCAGRAIDKVYTAPQKKLEERCQGPFGETFLSGTLAGKAVIAVYTVEKAVPCCYWRSYESSDKALAKTRLRWLKANAPTLEIGSEWLTIGPDNPPWPADEGPLKGGEYVPSICRSGETK